MNKGGAEAVYDGLDFNLETNNPPVSTDTTERTAAAGAQEDAIDTPSSTSAVTIAQSQGSAVIADLSVISHLSANSKGTAADGIGTKSEKARFQRSRMSLPTLFQRQAPARSALLPPAPADPSEPPLSGPFSPDLSRRVEHYLNVVSRYVFQFAVDYLILGKLSGLIDVCLAFSPRTQLAPPGQSPHQCRVLLQ